MLVLDWTHAILNQPAAYQSASVFGVSYDATPIMIPARVPLFMEARLARAFRERRDTYSFTEARTAHSFTEARTARDFREARDPQRFRE